MLRGSTGWRMCLDDEEDRGQQDEHPVDHQEREHPAPVGEPQQLRPEDRSDDRRQQGHEGEAREHPDQREASEEVPDHGRRDDEAGRGAHSLEDAEQPEHLDGGGERRPDARDDVEDARGEERSAATHPVTPWPDQQLPDPESEQGRGQGELDDRGADREVLLNRRERRKVEVDRERAERRQRSEDDHVDESLAT